MKVFVVVPLFCAVLLFVGLPESTLARTEAVPRTNQVWSECGGSCRQKSCDNPNENEQACVANCVEGWRCEAGYVRRSVPNGPCVLQADCPEPTRLINASVEPRRAGEVVGRLGRK